MGLLPVVNSTPVTHHEDQNEDFFVLDLADNTVVTDAVLPAAGQFFSQRGPKTARVFVGLDPFTQVRYDFSLNLMVKLR